MSTFKTREVSAALQRKGFELRDSHHSMFHLRVDGKDVGIHTKISHGERDIDDTLAGLMRKQMKLSTRKEFALFVECPMTFNEYLGILRSAGHLD